jgi:hypothetical protein
MVLVLVTDLARTYLRIVKSFRAKGLRKGVEMEVQKLVENMKDNLMYVNGKFLSYEFLKKLTTELERLWRIEECAITLKAEFDKPKSVEKIESAFNLFQALEAAKEQE